MEEEKGKNFIYLLGWYDKREKQEENKNPDNPVKSAKEKRKSSHLGGRARLRAQKWWGRRKDVVCTSSVRCKFYA